MSGESAPVVMPPLYLLRADRGMLAARGTRALAVVASQELVMTLVYFGAQCVTWADVEVALAARKVHEDDVFDRARRVVVYVRDLPSALSSGLYQRPMPVHLDVPIHQSCRVAAHKRLGHGKVPPVLVPAASGCGGPGREATVGEHFVWMTTRQIEPGTLTDFERTWRPDTHPEGMLRACAYWPADGREIIRVWFWASGKSCRAWRSPGAQARRREAMAGYVVGEQERFCRGRELHVPDH